MRQATNESKETGPGLNTGILLLYPTEIRNSRQVDSKIVHPIGLFFINAYLKKMGYRTKLMYILTVKDGIFFADNMDYQVEIEKEIKNFSPDYIGFSFRNLMHDELVHSEQLKDFFCVSLDKPVVDFIREITGVPIFGGGSALSLEPRMYMDYLNLDYAIIGEGEIAVSELIAHLDKKQDCSEIPGLVYRNGKSVVVNKNIPIPDYYDMPQMDSEGLADFKELFFDVGGYANVQTKRGCDFNCVFCNYPYLEGGYYRLRKVDDVIDEIVHLKKKYNVDNFFFIDSIFSTPTEHSADICRELIRRKVGIKWSGYINPKGVTKEVLDLYKESGCEKMIFGADALNDKLLSLYKKGFTQEEVRRFAGFVEQTGLNVEFRVILGGPGENEETVEETIDFCEKYLKHFIVNFQYGMLFFVSEEQKEMYKTNPYLSFLSLTDMGGAVLDNNLESLSKFHYFFEDVKENKEKFLDRIFEKVIAANRNIVVDKKEDKERLNRIIKKKIKNRTY